MNTIDEKLYLKAKLTHEEDKVILQVKGMTREDDEKEDIEGGVFEMMEDPIVQRKGDEFFIEWRAKV